MSQPSGPKTPDDLTGIYIRVKRNKSTYFLQCVPSETVLQIKEKLQELIDQPVNDQRLILMPNREVLDDSKSLADQKVENDAVVALALRKVLSFVGVVSIVWSAWNLHEWWLESHIPFRPSSEIDEIEATTKAKMPKRIFRLHNDNEFEEVNIERPNDFYHSRETDGSF